jgi:membrane protease YdiL (CAAX protease family)
MLLDALGLRRPVPGSVDWRYAAALLIGCGVAAALGLQTAGRVDGNVRMLVSLILWQPLIEELLFRGVLQGYLRRFSKGRKGIAGISAANALTTVGFVAIHFVHQPPPWALGVAVPSLLFGYFRDRSGSVWPAVLMHSLFNAAFFLS